MRNNFKKKSFESKKNKEPKQPASNVLTVKSKHEESEYVLKLLPSNHTATTNF